MRVGLDLDGVVADWSFAVRERLCQEFGYDEKKLLVDPRGEVPTWWWANDLGVSPEHWKWVWNVWAPSGGFRYLPPHPDAVQILQAAKMMGDICVVTSRPKCAWFDTLAWLDKHDVGPPHEIHFYEDGHNKHEADCDIYIEDAPHYAMALKDAGMNVLVVKRPYNEGVSELEPHRKTAEEILEHAKAINRNPVFRDR